MTLFAIFATFCSSQFLKSVFEQKIAKIAKEKAERDF